MEDLNHCTEQSDYAVSVFVSVEAGKVYYREFYLLWVSMKRLHHHYPVSLSLAYLGLQIHIYKFECSKYGFMNRQALKNRKQDCRTDQFHFLLALDFLSTCRAGLSVN